MRCFVSPCCKVLAALLFCCGLAHAGTAESWPAAPKLIELHTPYGTLNVSHSEYVYESRLLLDSIPVEPEIRGMLNIRQAFEMPGRQAALVSISTGSESCPISYQWVILEAGGYKVSPEFGSCSEDIRVSADARNLTLQTPGEAPGQVDTYVYDGDTVVKK